MTLIKIVLKLAFKEKRCIDITYALNGIDMSYICREDFI